MLLTNLLRATVFITGLSTVLAGPTSDVSVRSWGPPGVSIGHVVRAIGNTFSRLSLQKRDTVFRNSTKFEKSFDNVVLLSYSKEKKVAGDGGNGEVTVNAGVEIKCTTCYLKANVLADLTINGSFDFGQAISNITSEVGDAISNITDGVTEYFKDVGSAFGDGFDLDDFDQPIQIDLNIDVPEIPQSLLTIQFDELELYTALEITFSGGVTYTLNLYTSETPIGIAIDDVFLGIVADVDLILSVEAEITISSGFHIKVDDGAVLEIPLFGQQLTRTSFNGGLFEFLPVVIESAGVELKAILRVRIRAGFSVATPSIDFLLFNVSVPDLSAGIEVNVFAHIAELTTSITVTPAGDETGCQLRAEESYQFVLGAAAGASIGFQDHVWGAVAQATTPLWATTYTQCAIQAAGTTSAPFITARQLDDLTTTTTISTEVTYKGVECLSTGMIDCPVSLQKTTKVTSEITLVTSVPSGVEATFPTSVQATITSTIPFGTGVNKLFETAGPPTAYDPKTYKDSGTSTKTKIIIGVCAGVGGLLLIGGIVALVMWRRRKILKAMSSPQQTGFQTTQYYTDVYDPSKAVVFSTTEVMASPEMSQDGRRYA
ncbi:hypothetical protein H072_6528 [Dactylellina haptotyla CBS 200.50]|uniref:Mid2 domain-containing protein n=1 Tax=Dactylellina haptotyla (strain CBS 200.50) TaxID=1284197 RepID=S8BWI6_DACHA|nr:hypothetical protein H072_6528 [Dactylellina haptotyla CBS 200.50]